MQDKRAVPGCSDYSVHDEDGCPLWRISTPSHDSLCQWLEPVVDFVDIALGRRVTPVLVFDRGGAYPETMARLRDIGAELVTYERRPYPLLARTEYEHMFSITLPSARRNRSWSGTPSAPRRISVAGAAASVAFAF